MLNSQMSSVDNQSVNYTDSGGFSPSSHPCLLGFFCGFVSVSVCWLDCALVSL